jgi:hypothetical protein
MACSMKCKNGPALTVQNNIEAQKEALFVTTVDLLSVHVLKEDSAGNYQKLFLQQ